MLRYLALNGAPSVDLAVAANSGVYMLPDLTLDYPLGMGGLDLDENHVRRYLGRHLIILLGDADTDASAPDLPREDFAMAQGPNRLARGQWHFESIVRRWQSGWVQRSAGDFNRRWCPARKSGGIRPSDQYSQIIGLVLSVRQTTPRWCPSGSITNVEHEKTVI